MSNVIPMQKIIIDQKEYVLDALNEQARQQLQMIRFVDYELQQLAAKVALLRTARIAYGNALRSELPQ